MRLNRVSGEMVFYNKANSGLPSNIVYAISIDNLGNKWIGTWFGGLAKFGGVNWTVYNTSNSGLPSDYVYAISIDNLGNKWIGTCGGVAVYREGGVILDVYERKSDIIPKDFALYQNYPNPFDSGTNIEFDIAKRTKVRLVVYDVLGRVIKTLVDGEFDVGRCKVSFIGEGLPSGVYFYRLFINDLLGETSGFVDVKKMVLVK